MAKRGRPSDFTEALLEEICDRLAKGEPLAAICRDDHMPSDRTVRNWMERAEVSSAIARAREVGFDYLAAECLEIADDGSCDYKLNSRDGGPDIIVDSEHIQRSKLKIETRLKLLAKWDPKRYGDKLELNNNHGVQDSLADLMQRIDGKSRGLPG